VTLDPHTPVLVGAGQYLHRATSLDDARSPAELIAEAVRIAAADARLPDVPRRPDSLRVVSLLSWRYRDPARFVAAELGIEPAETALTTNGGNSPQMLVNATAQEIQRGDADLVILAGGEAWRTRMRARKDGAHLPWPPVDDDVTPGRLMGSEMPMSHEAELARGIMMPVQIYPMLESALRARAGRSVEEHQVVISELWSRFSHVAAANPHAWLRTPLSADEIRTVSPTNRMIGLPYPKYMNSNNDVDMAAALIMCSVERARSLGISEDRWVFPHAGSDCHEHQYLSERWELTETPAIALGGRAALELAGIGVDDVAVIDLYSCFPSAVELGAAALGLSLDRQLTRTGGLPFAGGPWNNYVTHAIATVVGDLRERPDEWGLVWGNGGYVTKHAFGVYSARPPAHGFRHAQPQAEIDALPRRALARPEDAAGPATVEAYTVMHSREGEPELAIASCRLADGRRAWGTSNEPAVAAAMCAGEWVGRPVSLDPAGTLHLD
jgi:acetyl-CoA C-acetyltransferase